MKNKTALIIGASNNPTRYSYKCMERMYDSGIPFVPMGVKKKTVFEKEILPPLVAPDEEIHTVTLYINRNLQHDYYDFIIELNPVRVIFNPGTENPELYRLLKESNIEPINACNLVMMATNQY